MTDAAAPATRTPAPPRSPGRHARRRHCAALYMAPKMRIALSPQSIATVRCTEFALWATSRGYVSLASRSAPNAQAIFNDLTRCLCAARSRQPPNYLQPIFSFNEGLDGACANAPAAPRQFWPGPPPCAGRSRDRHASDSGVCPSAVSGGTLFPAWSWPRRTRAGRPPQRHDAPGNNNPPALPSHIARGTTGRRALGTAVAHRPAAFRACAISMSTFIYLFLRPHVGFHLPNRAMSLSLLKFAGQASLVDEAMLPS